MWESFKNRITVILAAIVLFGLAAWCVVKPDTAVSDSERRQLATMPAVSFQSLLSGKFMSSFEKYATDQFPLRDGFRSLKAFAARQIFRNRDVNGIYTNADGYLSQMEYPLDEASIRNAGAKFRKVYDRYLDKDGVRVYLSVIPDKNYFMAEECSALSLDYAALVSLLRSECDNMEYLDIFDCLSLEDYYRTDTHWRQERILDVAERLAAGMGATCSGTYRENTLETGFYGVYAGQAAMATQPETLYYLTSPELDQCRVYDFETDSEMAVYDLEKALGRDPYEIFLSGSKSMLTLTNPNGAEGRRLILFRDSFGSSLAPLLAAGYSRIDLIDLRYLSSEFLERYVSFEDCDVLFLFSTLVLNNSITLK